MPKSRYFHGHGEKVLAEMRKRYGEDAERVFYATANARDQKPKRKARAKIRKSG